MPETTTGDREPPRPFSEFLFAQRGGATHAELTDGMAEHGTPSA